VWVWGSGFIGTGIPYASFSPPVQIPNLVNITQLAAGESWSYAVRSDGTLWSWGFNGNGQLGDGTATNRLTPVQVTGLSGVVAVASHFAHALALRSDGTVWAWGYNNSGQLGDGTVVERHAPVQVAGLSDVVAIGTGAFHSVALKRDGTVWAWGWNPNGLLGIGSTGFTQLVPAQVLGINAVAEITVGGFHTIAKKSDGSLWAWGWNSWGQLGLGTQTTSESMPTAVGGLSSIGPFVAGRIHSLAAKQAISFASFSAKVEISSSGSFEMNGTFALGSGSTGINPVTQPVTLQVGNFTAKIPAGSFLQNPRGHFVFEGFIDAVALEVNIVPLTDNTFAFRAEGVEANNLPTTNPVNVGLSIGNNVGTTMVTAEIE
jgi:hypothetical protein